MANIFLAISTKNNVANVIPVAELAQPGDRVCWLESDLAREDGWTGPANAVLRRHVPGVQPETIRVPGNDVTALAQALRTWLIEGLRVARGGDLFFVSNGGTKLHAIIATQVLAGFDFKAHDVSLRIVYSEDAKPGYSLTQRDDIVFDVKPYTRHRIDLAEILELRGVKFDTAKAKCLWRSPQLAPQTGRLHGITDRHRGLFARGPEAVLEYFRSYVPPLEELNAHAFATPRQARAFAPDDWHKLRSTLVDIVSPDRSRPLTDPQLEACYGAVRKLLITATDRSRSRELDGEPPRQNEPTGDPFEAEVARRFLAWLVTTNADEVVQSVWMNVKDGAGSDDVKFEFDIVIVLKNGILIHLECKAGGAKKKDLDARERNLQLAASSLARLFVCSPLLVPDTLTADDWQSGGWFRRQHELREASKGKHIPYTLSERNVSYEEPASKKQKRPAQRHQCPSFEEACDKLLRAVGLHQRRA